MKYFILFLVLVCFITCKKEEEYRGFPIGNIIDKHISFQYAIYFLDNHLIEKKDIIDVLKKEYPDFELLDSVPELTNVKGSYVVINEIDNVQKDYPPDSIDDLKTSTHGLTEKQKELLQTSKYVITLDFFCPDNKMVKTITDAHNLLLDLTKNSNSIIYDAETQEYFTRDFWEEQRKIIDGDINVSKHITILMYKKNDYWRAITLGMIKFGLPDICIENISINRYEYVENLINLTAQTLYEKKKIIIDGLLYMNIDSLQNDSLKKDLLSRVDKNAEKNFVVKVLKGKSEKGDPDNRLIEIGFSNNKTQMEQEIVYQKLFGIGDSSRTFTKNDEIVAASNRAKAKIPQLHRMFSKGLKDGTVLLFKFPFEDSEGDIEYLWLEVIKWENGKIIGLLESKPDYVTKYKAGQEIRKNVDEIFDYLIDYPDGREEGNETGKIIDKQNGYN